MARQFSLISFAMLGMRVVGCGGGKPAVKLYPVKGRVTVNGKPLTKCTISLSTQNPEKSAEGGYSSPLDVEGKFNIISTNGGAGAPIGKYKVTLLLPPEEAKKAMMGGGGKEGYEAAAPFPPEYGSPQTSKKEIEVKPQPNELNLEL